jgi:signal transduction histidine kinase/ligand-binding sensor domain-containing protein
MQAHSLLLRALLVAPVVLFGSALWGEVCAERLPIKNYSIADGLGSDDILRIRRDSRGFLWFCTIDGLSRFDGYRFTNYTMAHGLPDRVVYDLLETRNGVYWVATNGGLCLFNPFGAPALANAQPQPAEPMFTIFHPDEDTTRKSVGTLYEDRRGILWIGTIGGLFRLEQQGNQVKFHFEEMGMPNTDVDDRDINCLLEDRGGSLWVATGGSGVYRRRPDGRVERYTTQQGLPGGGAFAMLEDREGRLWMADSTGVWLMKSDPRPDQKVVIGSYKPQGRGVLEFFKDLLQTADGRRWASSDSGLYEFFPESGNVRFQHWATKHGLQHDKVTTLAEDGEGNLWFGTGGGGAHRLSHAGFTLFGETDGITKGGVAAIFEDQAGKLCLMNGSTRYLQQFNGAHWKTFRINRREELLGWGTQQIAFQSRTDEWWFASGDGLYRFPNVARVEDLARVKPLAVYTTRDGLVGNDIFRIFEDSRGDVWITAIHPARQALSRWQRATGAFQRFTTADGFPPGNINCFAEDSQGRIWMGGGEYLCRYEAGHFKRFSTPGLKDQVRYLHFDQAGRLWLATRRSGVFRVDNPLAEEPHIVSYTTSNGLSSDATASIAHDQRGRIYIATLRGLDRLDPTSDKIVHYTTADGLGRGPVHQVFLDRHGTIWAASSIGLARLTPEADPPLKPPFVFISGLRTAGIKQRVSELGEQALGGLTLSANQNNLSIDFFGLNFGVGEVLKYQYKLEGAPGDWSQPTEERTANFASLSPGSYRLLVRAVSSNGLTSATPATVSFRILRPIWQRWWFVMLAALVIGLTAVAFYRSRLKRVIELERVRARIATDLHDDIGSSLSQIAILSEVSRQRVNASENGLADALTQIANTSRDLVDVMSDIVWAINPKRDRLRDLTQRMREFTSEVFTARDIEFRFHGSADGHHIKLDADTRRQLYLICKEAVHNAARHSQCTEAKVTFAIHDHQLVLVVQDNGQGFESNGSRNGNGLDSMRQRARALGGKLAIRSQPQQGTTVTLKLPFPARTRARWRKYLPM